MSFFDKLILSFCRLGVAGLDPKAPGTWGTAIACLLAPYIFLPLSLPWRAVLLVAIFVVGGLASAPIIAVPTSIGYGASFQGLAALLSMLNSCANGVSVVNIDNGFGAGVIASRINHLTGAKSC